MAGLRRGDARVRRGGAAAGGGARARAAARSARAAPRARPLQGPTRSRPVRASGSSQHTTPDRKVVSRTGAPRSYGLMISF